LRLLHSFECTFYRALMGCDSLNESRKPHPRNILKPAAL